MKIRRPAFALLALILLTLLAAACPGGAAVAAEPAAATGSEEMIVIDPETGEVRPTSPTEEIIVVQPEPTTPTAEAAIPQFDRWAEQPKLGILLPVIRAWRTDKYVDVKFEKEMVVGMSSLLGQLILEQRPTSAPGFSKYSIIYQPVQTEGLTRSDWYKNAVSIRFLFQTILKGTRPFSDIEVSTPTVTYTDEAKRLAFDFRYKVGGRPVSGSLLGAPHKEGMFYFVLTLEGQSPEAVASAMRELQPKVTAGLTPAPPSRMPYVIAALLIVPAVAILVLLFLKKRRRPPAPIPQKGAKRKRRNS